MDRGRPRLFDREQALDAALSVFWRDGYLGASLSALTDAMKINKPSLYATFGNKADLYAETLDRYCRHQLFHHAEKLEADSDPREGLRRFLNSIVDMLTSSDFPGGCMVVNTAVSCESGLLPDDINKAIARVIKKDLSGLLRRYLKSANKKVGWPKDSDLETVADYIIALMSGMAVMSRVGINRARLRRIVSYSF